MLAGAAKQPPLEASAFTGVLPPKVAPPPRNGVYGGTAASRRVTESDDEFSDGLRGGMRCVSDRLRGAHPQQ